MFLLLLLDQPRQVGFAGGDRIDTVHDVIGHCADLDGEGAYRPLGVDEIGLPGLGDGAADPGDVRRTLLNGRGFRDQNRDQLLDPGDEPDQKQGIAEIKEGMKGGQMEGRGSLVLKRARNQHIHQGDCRLQQQKNPEDPEDIEDHMRPGAAFSVDGHLQRGEISGNRRSDILSQYDGRGEGERNPSLIDQCQGDGHSRAGGLDGYRQQGSEKDEEQMRKEPPVPDFPHHAQNLHIRSQHGDPKLHLLQAQKEQPEPEQNQRDLLQVLLSAEVEGQADGDGREREG